MIFASDDLSIQISNNSIGAVTEARNNHLAFTDYSSCIKFLESKGENFTKLYSLEITTTNKNSSLDESSVSKSDKLTSKLVDDFGNVIDTSSCGSFLVKYPIDQNLVNMTTYKNVLSKLGVDIFNKSEPFFDNICFAYSEDKDDITLLERRVKYNMTAQCGTNCVYDGIDLHYYLICNCTKEPDGSEAIFVNSLLDSLRDSNIFIITCVIEAFTNGTILMNFSLWIYLGLISLGLSICLVYEKFFSKRLMVKHLGSVLNYDAKFDNINALNDTGPAEVGSGNEDEGKIHIKEFERVSRFVTEFSPPANQTIVSYKPKLEESKLAYTQSIKKSSISLKMEKPERNSKNETLEAEYAMSINPTELPGHNQSDKPSSTSILLVNNFTDEKKLTQILDTNLRLMNSDVESKENLNSPKIKGKQLKHTPKPSISETYSHFIHNTSKLKLKSLKDIIDLPIELQISQDVRSTLQYFWDDLKINNLILNLVFVSSIVKPFTIRFIELVMSIGMNLFFNSLFFNDSYIDLRNQLKDGTTYSKNSFLYTFLNEFWKSLWSAMLSKLIVFLLDLIADPPEALYLMLNKGFLSNNFQLIESSR